MNNSVNRKTLGLAFSGSGNRTSFYIGFLEVLDEHKIPIDYISACSGGSLVAAAYACGNLEKFKQLLFNMKSKDYLDIATSQRGQGGLYSLNGLEKFLYENITNGKKFEEVKPLMTFITVDINSSETVELSMGDIAKAARISCTLPGIFEPTQWGNRSLVDGGILILLPAIFLKKYKPDVIIGVTTGGTKHVFAPGFLNLKKIYNYVKKTLFFEELAELFKNFQLGNPNEIGKKTNFFTNLGKSMDLAIEANTKMETSENFCSMIIKMKSPTTNKLVVNKGVIQQNYTLGRDTALANLTSIKQLLKE